ncbi:MAG: hypothetical protein ACLSTV_00670 [Coriobacteriales bacterium]|jgi:hypothetical protein|nr:hypothetical protein [Clostridia bacterium]PWM02407.1 MAG: hypothetical protein DBY05_02710 [Clostridiales bacterium]
MVYFSFFDLRESLLSLKEVLNFYDAQGRFRFQAKNQSYGYAHYSLRNAAGEEAGVIKRNPRGGVIYQWDNGVSVGPAIVTKLGRDFYDIYRNGKLFTSICLNPDMKSFVKSPFLLERIDWKIRRDWLLRTHEIINGRGECIARTSRSISDYVGGEKIEIADYADPVIVLSLLIAAESLFIYGCR